MRDKIVTFRLNKSEMRKLIVLTQHSKEFTARSINEAARFIVTKRLGEWYRPPGAEVAKILREN